MSLVSPLTALAPTSRGARILAALGRLGCAPVDSPELRAREGTAGCGLVDVKGKGQVESWLLVGPRDPAGE